MNVLGEIGDRLAAAAGRVEELDGRFLALALVLQIGTLAFRALAWRGVLTAAYPGRRIPVFSLGCAYAAGVALNAYLPARGGEAAKVALARAQIRGSSIPTLAASLSVVMLVDALLGGSFVIALWASGVLPSLPALPTIPGLGLAPVLLGVAAAGAVALALVARRFATALRRALDSAALGLAVLRTPTLYLRKVLPFQLAAWACRIGVVYLVLQAFRIDAGLETAALVVVLNGAATAVPVPGGAGSQQLLATYALQGVISTAGAVSFSLGMQAGVTVTNTLVGLAATMILLRTLRPVAAVRAAAWSR
ncbi:MAG TPA: lysylphosphatidylglycerol synthase domain-containing protein [Gaiellaceae bacterium]|nr:lysylphosphatidylglycerol synthase domain-containing protein [Gaiellaceae bacterium]